jgi:thiol:disulfide interchange protein DsbD
MLAGRRKKPLRLLLFFLLFIVSITSYRFPPWLSTELTHAANAHGPYQGQETNLTLMSPGPFGSLYDPSTIEKGTHNTAPSQDLLVQVQGDSGLERRSQKQSAAGGIWLTLLALFLGGLALNLTPCVYPLIPITISYFGGKSERIRGHTIVHGIFYMFGLAVTNSLLGLSAALSGGMLGAALQHPLVLIFVASVMVAMGLSFFGLWELRLPQSLTQFASKGYPGFLGTFFMGLTLGIVAAPCLGPFILGLLIYVGQMGNPFLGFLYFFVLSIGLGLPLAILAVFSGALARLPKSGDWMLWIRKLMGWVLMAMAAFMISFVVSQDLFRPALLAGVAIAAGIHLGWLDKTGKNVRVFSYAKKIAGVAIVCGGIIYLLLGIRPAGKIAWMPYDQAILAKAAEEKKPLIIDFYADWCAPCRIMDKEVFSDHDVVKLMRNLITVQVDLTNVKPSHDRLLRQYQIRGIPTTVFINRQGTEETKLRIVGLVTKSEFIKRLTVLLNRSDSMQE